MDAWWGRLEQTSCTRRLSIGIRSRVFVCQPLAPSAINAFAWRRRRRNRARMV